MYSSLSADFSGNAILANGVPSNPPIYTDKYILELFNFNPNGSTNWKKGFALNISGYTQGEILSISKMDATTTNGIYLTGQFADESSLLQFGPQFIIKTDAMGNPIKWKAIRNFRFFELVVADDGIYLWDKIPNYDPWDIRINVLDKSSTRLIKLDHDLNFLWGKRYRAENFKYFSASIVKTNAGKLVMSHTTFDAFPVVLTELDNEGNILSQKGYPNYEPTTRTMNDGSLLLCSPNYNNVSFNPIIAKTDTNGDIEGCPTFETCMTVEDFLVDFDTFQIDTFEITDLEVLPPLEITPVSVSFSPYCDYPPAPQPSFGFPDTIFCLGDTATTFDTEGNRLAQAREWLLTGPGTSVALKDSFEFSHQFTEPGEYVLAQSIWVLGCRTDYERSITVLPPFSVAVAADNSICPGEPAIISAEASRSASYLWNDGATSPSRTISASGTYAVTATDGHCEAADSATVVVVADLLGGSPPFTLPRDTITCTPFELVPQSLFTDQFFLDGGPAPASSFTLEAAGSYRIEAEVFGCGFWEVYEYGVDCHVDIYLPNSFSPNGDGINDVFQAYGSGFEVLELAVFDRWGGLLHKGKSWDGGKAGPGLYLYKLNYTNLRSGEKVERSGEVLLVK